MSKARRPPPGRGAAIARQMGLLVDLSPEGTAGDDAGDDAAELEAELLALVGGRAAPGEKPKGKTPLPMEAIEKMAALCMRDPDEEEEEGDDDEELADEDDLMAELQEVLGEGEGSAATPAPPAKVPEPPPEPSGIEATLAERAGMYRAAIASARQAGDGSRLRRYERGLKTLENMLASVKKGKKIAEEEIPPPVALGKGASPPQPSPEPPLPAARPSSPQPPPQPPPALLRGRQREYKLAALHAKQRQDLEMATKFYRVAKSFDSLLEAVGKGQPVELSSVPPPPGKTRTGDGERPYPLFGGTEQPPRQFRSSWRTQQSPRCSFAGADRSLLPTDQLPKEPVSQGQPQPAASSASAGGQTSVSRGR
ncbi:unnamed protein product [Bubo scandiacus]